MPKIFENADDRDASIMSWAVVALTAGVIYFFKDALVDQIEFIAGSLLALIATIINHYFRKNGGSAKNGGDAFQQAWLESMKQRPDPAPVCDKPHVEDVKQQPASNPTVSPPVVPVTPVASATQSVPSGNLLAEAKKHIGLDENSAAGGLQIQAWAKQLGFSIPADGSVSWCCIFAGAMLKAAGYEPMKTMRARDYATYGEEGDGSPGDLFVAQSHIGIIEKDTGDGHYDIIGGNQSDKVCVLSSKYFGQPLSIRRPVV